MAFRIVLALASALAIAGAASVILPHAALPLGIASFATGLLCSTVAHAIARRVR